MERTTEQQAILTAGKRPTGNLLIEALAGTGKCLGRGTPVLLWDGRIIPVENVTVGMQLMGPDSAPRRVLKTNVGVGPLFKITPVKGEAWVCNDAHVMTLAGTNYWQDETRDVPLNEHIEWCAARGQRLDRNWKLMRTGVDFPVTEIDFDPYLAGLWLGDGTFAKPQITNCEPEIIAYCEAIAPTMNCECVVTPIPDGNTNSIYFKMAEGAARGRQPGGDYIRAPFTRMMDQLKLSDEKHIPHALLCASRYARLQLLAGLIDTDGHVELNHVEITSKYAGLSAQIVFLARSLGLAAYRSNKRATIKALGFEGDYFRVTISGDTAEIPVRVPRRQASPRRQIKRVTVTGWDAEPIGDGEFFGFTLDCDGRFLLGDFTVTHNSSVLKWLLETVPQKSILICAFNKRIADDMQASLPPIPKGTYVEVKTFHSKGLGVLKSQFPRVAVDKMATEEMINRAAAGQMAFVMRRAAVNTLRMVKDLYAEPEPPTSVFVLGLALEYNYFDKVPSNDAQRLIVDVVRDAYALSLDMENRSSIDYCDMVWAPVALGIMPKSRYQGVFVDELQDISQPQLAMLRALVAPGGRMVMVGDKAQCIPAGQMVTTPAGPKLVEDVREGDRIACVSRGERVFRPVIKRTRTRKCEALEFDIGPYGKFQATEEHVCFAALGDPHGAYVYLMYRHDLGFRLGITEVSGRRKKVGGGIARASLMMRTGQEGGERLWVLDRFNTAFDATLLEEQLSLRYRVPTAPFKARVGGNWDQTVTDALFGEFGENGIEVLRAYALDFERPSYWPKGNGGDRIAINLLLAGKGGHRVEVETSQLDSAHALALGFRATTRGHWRLRREFKQYRDARALADRLREAVGGHVVEHLSGTTGNHRMFSVRASNIHPGMTVPVVGADGRMRSTTVLARKTVPALDCFDFEVDGLANFIVGNAVVHNSIYKWRGADAEKMFALIERDLKPAKFPLTVTWRCAQAIVKEANQLVPSLKARPDAPMGSVQTCAWAGLPHALNGGTPNVMMNIRLAAREGAPHTFVLSRNNSMLLDCALYLWRSKVRFELNAGKDLLDPLFTLLDTKLDLRTPALFTASVTTWEREELARAEKAHATAYAERIEEQAAMLRVAVTYAPPARIKDLLSDLMRPNDSGVLLSSVHKVKGLEAERVFLLRQTFGRHAERVCPACKGDGWAGRCTVCNGRGKVKPTPDQEEFNIEYVAITRAISRLIWVDISERNTELDAGQVARAVAADNAIDRVEHELNGEPGVAAKSVRRTLGLKTQSEQLAEKNRMFLVGDDE